MTNFAEQLKQGAGQAWESLSEGWRELSTRASNALTRFRPEAAAPQTTDADDAWVRPGRWAFLAADVLDEGEQLVVRIEAPGMRREDLQLTLEGQTLSVQGEKRIERCAPQGRWRVQQCAYGSFRRSIELPVPVKADRIEAQYRDGVLRIALPKADHARPRRIEVRSA